VAYAAHRIVLYFESQVQSGRHERMHLTLKEEAIRPPGFNSPQQQARFDAFLREFNVERPHEVLDVKYPAELYSASARSHAGLPELIYPFHDRDVIVTACGRLCLHRKRINISTVLAGQKLGIKEVDDGIWLVSFMRYDLGYFDLEQKILQPLGNPFGTRLSPTSYVQDVTYMSGLDKAGGESGIRTHGTVSRTHAFQACALSHSAISPDALS
jgi:Integrase core domain